jgi:hypothetical protein
VSDRRPAVELLEQGAGVLDSGHLAELGWSRRGMEALWRNCPVIALDDFARPLLRVEAYLAFLEGHTYCDHCADRVRPGRLQRQSDARRGDTSRVIK